MNGFVVVDASVWVARLLPQDVFHQPSRTWMEHQRSAHTTFLAPGLLLAEVGGAVSRRTGEPRLANRLVHRLQELPGLRLVQMDHELARMAASLAAELGLRGADAFYVAVASRLDIPLVTLDEDQLQRATLAVDVNTLSS